MISREFRPFPERTRLWLPLGLMTVLIRYGYPARAAVSGEQMTPPPPTFSFADLFAPPRTNLLGDAGGIRPALAKYGICSHSLRKAKSSAMLLAALSAARIVTTSQHRRSYLTHGVRVAAAAGTFGSGTRGQT